MINNIETKYTVGAEVYYYLNTGISKGTITEVVMRVAVGGITIIYYIDHANYRHEHEIVGSTKHEAERSLRDGLKYVQLKLIG